jgi:hypothetical protein
MIKYGGGVSSATLTIGEQTATITDVGTLSIKPDTVGTFTPVLTVTDTRGQTTTKELAEITVQQWQNLSANWGTVQSNTNGYYAGKTTASVTISNITVMSGFNITSAQFIVGSEKQTISSPSGSSITFSLPLNVVGTFTPQVKINTDAYVTTTHSYSQITVNEYISPSVNIEIERTKINTSGEPDIEGENAVITATFNYLNSGFDLIKPEVLISEADNQSTPENATITWYQTRNSSNGVVSNAVNWSSYNTQSPVTLYGLITGYGTTTKLSSAQSFQILITPKDSASSGTQISQVLPFSFYTIDFQAGGKEIAFGAPANEDLTNVNGKNYSDEGLFKCNMGTAFNDMTTQEISNFVGGLDYTGLNVVDYVVDQGTSDIWTYRKWNSGILEQWCIYNPASYAITTARGNLYSGANISLTYPIPFIAIPVINGGASLGTDAYVMWLQFNGFSSTACQFRFVSSGSIASNQYLYAFIYAIGRWK